MNTTIRLFLITENEQSENDFLKLSDYIASVNEHFERNYCISVEMLTIENFDMPDWQIEEELYQPLRECEAVFFLVFTKMKNIVLKSFDEIWHKFKAEGKPSIYTYFFGSDDSIRDESVQNFMNRLDKQLGHYYSRYDHIDTIKLKIAEILSLQKENAVEMTFKNGHLIVDGKKMMSLENVAIYSANDNLRQLKEELSELEKEYFPMKAEYGEKQNDMDFYRRYADIASKRKNIIEEIADAEKKLFEASLKITKDNIKGELTPRQREAYRYLEMGRSEKANAILDAEEMNADFDREMQLEEEKLKKRAVLHIREHSTKIDVLKTMTKYDGRFDDIIASYERIKSVALRYHVEYDMIRQYANYLYQTHQLHKAYEVVKEVEDIFENTDMPIINKISFFNLTSNIMSHMPDKVNETLACYNKCIVLLNNTKDLTTKLLSQYAVILDNIGMFSMSINYVSEAEDYLLNANSTLNKIVCGEDANVNYISLYAKSCNDLGYYYNNSGQFDKAEEYYIRALQIRYKLASKYPDDYLADYSQSCNNAGMMYINQGKYQSAKKYLDAAFSIRQKLAEEDPNRYQDIFSVTCNNLGLLYHRNNLFDEAEIYFLKAVDIHRHLSETNDEMFSFDYTKLCRNSAKFYIDFQKYDKAEVLLLNAFKKLEQLVSKNTSVYIQHYIDCCMELSDLYSIVKDIKSAEAYCGAAMEVTKILAQKQPDKYMYSYVSKCFTYGILSKSETHLKEAYEIAEKLSEDSRYGWIIKMYNELK